MCHRLSFTARLRLALSPILLLTHSRVLAQGTHGLDLLLHPEIAFVSPSRDVSNFNVSIDGKPLSYSSPTIIFQTNSPEVDFVSGFWKDPKGGIIHQREVLIVKPDYGVVVDHLYGEEGKQGERQVSCITSLEAKGLKTEGKSSLFDQGFEKGLLVRHLAPDVPTIPTIVAPGSSDPAVPPTPAHLAENCRITLPSPFATLFCIAEGALPKFEYVKPSNPMIVKGRITMPDGRIDDVGIAWEPRDLHLGGKHFKGWAAVARQAPKTQDSDKSSEASKVTNPSIKTPIHDIEIKETNPS